MLTNKHDGFKSCAHAIETEYQKDSDKKQNNQHENQTCIEQGQACGYSTHVQVSRGDDERGQPNDAGLLVSIWSNIFLGGKMPSKHPKNIYMTV